MPPLNGPECREPFCYARTREGKPYCPKHLERMPYVKAIIEEHTARVAEANGSPTISGHYDDDILVMIKTIGPRTTAGLSRDLGIPEVVVKRIITNMKTVRLGRTKRGLITVELR